MSESNANENNANVITRTSVLTSMSDEEIAKLTSKTVNILHNHPPLASAYIALIANVQVHHCLLNRIHRLCEDAGQPWENGVEEMILSNASDAASRPFTLQDALTNTRAHMVPSLLDEAQLYAQDEQEAVKREMSVKDLSFPVDTYSLRFPLTRGKVTVVHCADRRLLVTRMEELMAMIHAQHDVRAAVLSTYLCHLSDRTRPVATARPTVIPSFMWVHKVTSPSRVSKTIDALTSKVCNKPPLVLLVDNVSAMAEDVAAPQLIQRLGRWAEDNEAAVVAGVVSDADTLWHISQYHSMFEVTQLALLPAEPTNPQEGNDAQTTNTDSGSVRAAGDNESGGAA